MIIIIIIIADISAVIIIIIILLSIIVFVLMFLSVICSWLIITNVTVYETLCQCNGVLSWGDSLGSCLTAWPQTSALFSNMLLYKACLHCLCFLFYISVAPNIFLFTAKWVWLNKSYLAVKIASFSQLPIKDLLPLDRIDFHFSAVFSVETR